MSLPFSKDLHLLLLCLLSPLGSRSISSLSPSTIFSFFWLEPSLLFTTHKITATQLFKPSHITTTSSPAIIEKFILVNSTSSLPTLIFTAQLAHPPLCQWTPARLCFPESAHPKVWPSVSPFLRPNLQIPLSCLDYEILWLLSGGICWQPFFFSFPFAFTVVSPSLHLISPMYRSSLLFELYLPPSTAKYRCFLRFSCGACPFSLKHLI